MDLFDYLFPKRCIGCRKFGEYICSDCFTKISFDVECICLVCNRNAINGITHPLCRGRYTIDGSSASLVYKGITKRLISAFKYKPYLSDLQKTLTDFFYEGIIQNEQFQTILKKDSILVPIPLHPEKYRMRSYNQAEILAKNLGKKLNLPVCSLLKRIKKTQTQTTLKREERKENIKDAFIIDEKVYINLFDNNLAASNAASPSSNPAPDGTGSNAAKAMKQSNIGKVKNDDPKIVDQLKNMRDTRQVIFVDDVITSGATMLEAANMLKRKGVEHIWGIALAHGR
jgi:predicted amidophosphoribosyltransferase